MSRAYVSSKDGATVSSKLLLFLILLAGIFFFESCLHSIAVDKCRGEGGQVASSSWVPALDTDPKCILPAQP